MGSSPKAEACKAEASAPKLKGAAAVLGKELPPWEQYLQVNAQFTQQGHFMHTLSWEAEGRIILTVVPHPTRVDMDKLARAVWKPRGAVRQRKLKDIEKDT